VDYNAVRGELNKLPRVSKEEKGQRPFEFQFRDKGWLIPVCTAFLRTQSDDSVNTVFDHFEKRLGDWEEKGVRLDNIPRFALYHVLSHHMAISARLSTTGEDTGNRYLKVGRDYDQMWEKLRQTQGAAGDVYRAAHGRYVSICRAIDPALDGKVVEAQGIPLPGEPVIDFKPPVPTPVHEVKPPEPARRPPASQVERTTTKLAQLEKQQAGPTDDRPTGLGIHAPLAAPPQKEAIPSLSFTGFDEYVTVFERGYKDRVTMAQNAGLNLMSPEFKLVFLDINKTGGEVKDEGFKMPALISFIRKGKSPATAQTIVKHMEERLGDYEQSMLAHMDDNAAKVDLPRLALYRTLAYEIGYGEGISQKTDETGKRWRTIGEKYRKLAGEMPDDLFEQYAQTEDKYLQMARALYPDLVNKLPKT
jgi:hypothetical protein